MEGREGKEESTLPPGFRFHPSDEELITYYLMSKFSDANFTGKAIGDVDLNKCEPWELPGKAKMGEKEWYFFSLRDRKYPTGVRTNRATNTGYWKTTGKDKEIYSGDASELVGMKKTLVFYKGRAPRGEKSNWVMHEYRVHSKSAYRINKEEWVVCRVFQKSAGFKKYPSNHSRVVNPYPYNQQEFPQNPMQLQIMQPDNFQLPGRSYMAAGPDIQELNKVLRGGSGSMINFPFPPQLNYGIGGSGSGGEGPFTISGLNPNRSGGAAPTQPYIRPAPPPEMIRHDMSSFMLAGGVEIGNDQAAGHGGDMNNANAMISRFMGMDNGVDLDTYWPSY